MNKKRKPITPDQLRDWASRAQLKFLDAVMVCGAFKAHELAFHGGTSLHMSWASPRFSEDLDFIVTKSYAQALPRIMKDIERKMREAFLVEDPSLIVEVRNKTKDDGRLGNFHIVVSHEKVIGNAMVKAEFWMVDNEYLKGYPTTFRTPMIPGNVVARVSSPIPAAELVSAYADKLTAFATRPFLKWRDLYDLWWLGTQARAIPDPGSPDIIAQFKHNLSAYNTPAGMTPGQALARFHGHNVDDLVKQAESDLRRWLPASHWDALVSSDGIRGIVRYVDESLRTVVGALGEKVAVQNVQKDAGAKTRRPRP